MVTAIIHNLTFPDSLLRAMYGSKHFKSIVCVNEPEEILRQKEQWSLSVETGLLLVLTFLLHSSETSLQLSMTSKEKRQTRHEKKYSVWLMLPWLWITYYFLLSLNAKSTSMVITTVGLSAIIHLALIANLMILKSTF